MDPVELLCLERGLTVHLESEHLLELTLGGERQRYRLRQHVRLVDPEHARPAGSAGQFRQARRPDTEMTERGLFPASTQIDTDGFGPLGQGPNRSEYQRIGSIKGRTPQTLRQKIRKLSRPPSEKLTYHVLRSNRSGVAPRGDFTKWLAHGKAPNVSLLYHRFS